MRLAPCLTAITAMGLFAALAAYTYARYQPYAHEQKSYTPAQVKSVGQLVKPDLVRPKTAKERAEIIAGIWGLKAGNYEIGSLK